MSTANKNEITGSLHIDNEAVAKKLRIGKVALGEIHGEFTGYPSKDKKTLCFHCRKTESVKNRQAGFLS